MEACTYAHMCVYICACTYVRVHMYMAQVMAAAAISEMARDNPETQNAITKAGGIGPLLACLASRSHCCLYVHVHMHRTAPLACLASRSHRCVYVHAPYTCMPTQAYPHAHVHICTRSPSAQSRGMAATRACSICTCRTCTYAPGPPLPSRAGWQPSHNSHVTTGPIRCAYVR